MWFACFEVQGLPASNTGSLQQLSGLNALGVQQLLAASTQNSLASSQGNGGIWTRSEVKSIVFYLNTALQNLASLQNQGLGLGSSNGSPASADMNPAALSGLAALANFTTNSSN